MPGCDTHRDAADAAAPLPRRAPGDTDLRIFTTELIPSAATTATASPHDGAG